MNKRIVTLLSGILILGVLIAVFLLISNIDDEGDGESTTSPPVVSYYVSQIDRGSLYSMGFTYKENTFDLTLKQDGTGWLLKGKESLPISNVAVALMVQHFETMTTDFMIESPSEEKLKEYGFEDPTAEIYFYDKAGRHGFTVGVLNSFNSMYYIRSSHDSENVYLVRGDFMEDFMLEEKDLLQIEEIPQMSLSKDATITLQTEKDTLKYKYYASGKSGYLSKDAKWFLSINGGIEFPINEDIAKRLSESAGYLGFAECVSYSADDMEKYGLKNPVKLTAQYTSVTVETDSETGEEIKTESNENIAFILGSKDKDNYSYAMTENSPLIYVTVSDIFHELYDFDVTVPSKICTGYIFNTEKTEIDEVSFTYQEKDYILKISEDAVGMSYTLNESKIDKEKVLKFLEAIAVISWDTDKSKESSTATEKSVLKLTVKSEGSSSSAEFTGYSDKFFGVSLDFTDQLLVSEKSFEKITSSIDELIK